MQIYSMVFPISRQINKKKYAKTVNLICAGNKVFVKYQAQGGGLNPNPACVRPCPCYLFTRKAVWFNSCKSVSV